MKQAHKLSILLRHLTILTLFVLLLSGISGRLTAQVRKDPWEKPPRDLSSDQLRSSQPTRNRDEKATKPLANILTSINVKDIHQPSPLGLLEFDAQYKVGCSFLSAKNYEEAANAFSSLYKRKPDYPTLALYYGEALANLNKNEEALAVWLSIPLTEKHSFINFNIGVLLYRLQRYQEASKYFRFATNDLKRSDCRYWVARTLLIISEKDTSSMKQFISRTNEFIEIIENDILDLSKHQVKQHTKYEVDINQIGNDVFSRKQCAFYLLWVVSKELTCKEGLFDDSLAFALRAVDQLPGPFLICTIPIDKQQYISFLEHLSFLLVNVKERNRHLSMLDSMMKKIEKHNGNTQNEEIADFAMLIRSFYGTSGAITSIKKGEFKIAYGITFTDKDSGVGSIDIMSPKYLAGRKRTKIVGQKQYRFEEAFFIGPKTVLDEKPYFTITCADIVGNSTTANLFPVIKMIR